MVKRYKKPNFPIEAFNNFNRRYIELNKDALKLTKKTIPKTKFFVAISRKPVWFDDEEIKAMTKRNTRFGGRSAKLI